MLKLERAAESIGTHGMNLRATSLSASFDNRNSTCTERTCFTANASTWFQHQWATDGVLRCVHTVLKPALQPINWPPPSDPMWVCFCGICKSKHDTQTKINTVGSVESHGWASLVGASGVSKTLLCGLESNVRTKASCQITGNGAQTHKRDHTFVYKPRHGLVNRHS